MKELKNEVLEDFSFSNDQLKEMKTKEIKFSGEICEKCKIYVNVPRLEKFWSCHNCKTENFFDKIHFTLPFNNPDAGPSKRRIEFPLSYSSMVEEDYYAKGGFI